MTAAQTIRASAQAVDTAEFWRLMCDPRTVRLDYFSLANGRVVYTTAIPPEELPDFMRRKALEGAAALVSTPSPLRMAINRLKRLFA